MNQIRSSLKTEPRKPAGSAPPIFVNRTVWAASLLTVSTLLILLTSTNGLQAEHNKLLQLELRRAISRQLACDSEGYCYLLLPSPELEGGGGFTLQVSRKRHPESLADFSTTVTLPTPAVSDTARNSWFSAGLAVDTEDRLHLICTTHRGQTAYSVLDTRPFRSGPSRPLWVHPLNGQEGMLVLAAARSWAGDICQTPDGQVWLTWTTRGVDASDVAVHLGTVRDGAWQSFEMGGGKKFYPPSLLFSQEGTFFHLACGDHIGFTHTIQGRVADLGTARQGRFEQSHSGHRPALAETTTGILAVHRSADNLKYTLLKGESHQSRSLTDLDSRFVWDTVHSPSLLVDQHRVPWMFFIDSTRQHVFYSRWLGTRWSPIMNGFWLTRNTARFEDNHLAVDWLSVARGFGEERSSIGLAIGNRSQFPAAKFHMIDVPTLRSDPGKKVLFLDLKEVQHIDGLDLRLNTARKLPNPVITGGRTGEFDSQGAANIAVIRKDGVYQAWYSGLYREPGSQWPASGPLPYVRLAYAESSDGRQFTKKPLGLSTFGDNDNTNLVAGLPATPIYRPIVSTGMHIDLDDPDATRRYKLLTWSDARPLREGLVPDTTDTEEEQTWTLWTAPDGLHWREASRGGIRYPGGMVWSFNPQALFHDPDERDPAKKYKAYGVLCLNNDRRAGGYGYSADAVQWTADPANPIFDPWARAISVVRNGKVQQIHDVVVWKHHQYYLALYQYQHHGEEMTIELAMSRDGENFTYVEPGSEVVRRGAAGAWDSEMIAPSVPLVDEDEIKVYYTGYRFSNTHLIEGERSCGLATLRLDGYTHLTLEEGHEHGSVTTIPVDRGSATELIINASCADGSRIEVELIEAGTDQSLPGFSREECTPMTSDSLGHQVGWEYRTLAEVPNASFQIRFHLTRGDTSPELYSFEFHGASDE